MGWLRTIFLGDIGNRLDIADNEDRIRRMQLNQRGKRQDQGLKDRSQDEAIALLQAEVNELQVAVGTMATVLVSKGVVAEEELGRLFDAIESDPD